ncbi:DUF443 family protein [Staphylococcus aureus]|uniref:DUF443 family protein n=1 Tax=Staphylococcus aureus TaxID=1280 RepID=UPI001CDAAC23|nr:DUF443 family protein [Staphylococcus aureus]MEA3590320.1 DUF443 family protein [Staphylococcus aureus]WRN22380.1 DUF443 family protein [Staphylococcus aureus]
MVKTLYSILHRSLDLTGGGSFFTIYMLLTIEVQNIILFITLFVIFLFFLFLNMCSLYDNKVHVLFKSNGIEKF